MRHFSHFALSELVTTHVFSFLKQSLKLNLSFKHQSLFIFLFCDIYIIDKDLYSCKICGGNRVNTF